MNFFNEVGIPVIACLIAGWSARAWFTLSGSVASTLIVAGSSLLSSLMILELVLR